MGRNQILVYMGYDVGFLYICIHHYISASKISGLIITGWGYENQWEGLSHILWKIKAMFETTNLFFYEI